MGLETGTYINSLVSTNPLGTDAKSAGDDHIRLLKATIKATFPNITGALTATHTQLNYVTGVTSAIQTQLDGKVNAGANSSITSLTGLTTPLSETQGGTGQATYTQGDILYASAANVLSKLPKGTTGQVLTQGATVPAWSTPASSGVTSVTGTAPVVSSGGTTPAISMPEASAGANGYMSAAYAAKLDSLQPSVPLDVGAGGVGTIAVMFNKTTAIASGATVAGSSLGWAMFIEGSTPYVGANATGTWRNISGTAADAWVSGSARGTTFQRIA